jgi:threonine dehydrogenase-like Zn-dependent dehydrogenase
MPANVATGPRFLGDGKIIFEERPVPSPQAGELLVRVRANAICGTDRGQYFEGSTVTPGHEASGVVVAVGPETSVREGTAGVLDGLLRALPQLSARLHQPMPSQASRHGL